MHPNKLVETDKRKEAHQLIKKGMSKDIIPFLQVGLPFNNKSDFTDLAWFSKEYYHNRYSEAEIFFSPDFESEKYLKELQKKRTIPVSDFYDLRSGQKINAILNSSIYQKGRFKNVRLKGKIITPQLDITNPAKSTAESICPVFTNQIFTLRANGTIDMCGFFLREHRPYLGEITESAEILAERFSKIMKKARTTSRRNLLAIMQGNSSTWFCKHPEWFEK